MAQRSTKIKKAQLLKALHSNMGIVSHACEAANIPRRTAYNWIRDDPQFKEAINDSIECTFDFVEGKILEQIREGNTTMTIFFAKTRMRSRGYIERSELSMPDLPSFVIKDNKEAAKKVLNLIHKKNAAS